MERRKLSVQFLMLMLFLGCVVSSLQASSDVKFYEEASSDSSSLKGFQKNIFDLIYKVADQPFLGEHKIKVLSQQLSKLLAAIICLTETVSDSAESIGIVSKDLKEFILSDSDQIPNSFKQIAKFARSNEYLDSLTKITGAVTIRIFNGCRQERLKSDNLNPNKSAFSDKLFSDSGSGFASVIVGSFAKNLVMGYYSEKKANSEGSDNDSLGKMKSLRLIDMLNDDKCKELIGDSVQRFVSTLVTVFLDKTMHIYTYDGMTNSKHEGQVKEMLTTLCNITVETLVKTSHQVWQEKKGVVLMLLIQNSDKLLEKIAKHR